MIWVAIALPAEFMTGRRNPCRCWNSPNITIFTVQGCDQYGLKSAPAGCCRCGPTAQSGCPIRPGRGVGKGGGDTLEGAVQKKLALLEGETEAGSRVAEVNPKTARILIIADD